jgi:hypothetical protein
LTGPEWWVLCVIPVLAAGLGYLVLRLPAVDRAVWRSASLQAHLMTAAAAGHYPGPVHAYPGPVHAV